MPPSQLLLSKKVDKTQSLSAALDIYFNCRSRFYDILWNRAQYL